MRGEPTRARGAVRRCWLETETTKFVNPLGGFLYTIQEWTHIRQLDSEQRDISRCCRLDFAAPYIFAIANRQYFTAG